MQSLASRSRFRTFTADMLFEVDNIKRSRFLTRVRLRSLSSAALTYLTLFLWLDLFRKTDLMWKFPQS